MHVVVLLKQTFDTEEKVQVQNGQIVDDGVKLIINPYDEYAVEEAIRIREAEGGQVTVVSVGTDKVTEALRTALAMGADNAVLVSDPALPHDEFSISRALTAYLQSANADVILGGFFSVDNGAGQVAIRVARALGIPHVSAITKLTLNGSKAIAVRDAEGDTETVEIDLPALFTAQQGLNDPRYPSLPGIMKAKKKQIQTLSLSDLGLSAADIPAKTERTSLSAPPARTAGQKLSGDLASQAAQLAALVLPHAQTQKN